MIKFSNAWKILILILPMLGSAERLVHPQRDDLAGRSFIEVEMPESTYTNGLVFYMDADAGAYNAGATNYFIPDISTNRNDATQTVINSQPTITTNGLSLDGVDDQCEFDIPFLTNATYVIYAQTITNSATSVGLGLGAGNNGVNREHIANLASIWAYYTWRRESNVEQVVLSNSNYPKSGGIECFVLRRTMQDFSITTRLGKNTRTLDTPWSSAPRINGIGRTAVSGGYVDFFTGNIAGVIIFDRVITDDEANYFIQRNPQ